MSNSKLVVIESPYAGNVEQNIGYLERAFRDSFSRGEFPYASHGLYPYFLDDSDPQERKLGMEAGFAWGAAAGLVAVYEDYGISQGMRDGIQRAHDRNQKTVFRRIGRNDEAV